MLRYITIGFLSIFVASVVWAERGNCYLVSKSVTDHMRTPEKLCIILLEGSDAAYRINFQIGFAPAKTVVSLGAQLAREVRSIFVNGYGYQVNEPLQLSRSVYNELPTNSLMRDLYPLNGQMPLILFDGKRKWEKTPTGGMNLVEEKGTVYVGNLMFYYTLIIE